MTTTYIFCYMVVLCDWQILHFVSYITLSRMFCKCELSNTGKLNCSGGNPLSRLAKRLAALYRHFVLLVCKQASKMKFVTGRRVEADAWKCPASIINHEL